ncbi:MULTISPECIES: hypothetical protein [unclassified Rickettsia]|uniref:hypothetical protein n=1 Tax=unclassified Rickettsia TaxID=114295 RepID=UPI00313315CA
MTEFLPLYLNVRTVVGLTTVSSSYFIISSYKSHHSGVVAWMVKNALGVIPAQAGIQKIIVILNLFQDLL